MAAGSPFFLGREGVGSHLAPFQWRSGFPQRHDGDSQPTKRSRAGSYKPRARIEQAVDRLKRFKRIALRCKKTARNFLSFFHLFAGVILIKFVQTA